MRIGIFDLGSFFWTLAGVRSKEEGAHGLALQVARYMRERAEKGAVDVVLFASDGPPELPSRSWRLRVDGGYKSHRAPKDEAQRAELVALVGALESAGFPVVAADEGKRWPDNEHGPSGPDERVWFEADDVAFAAARKVASSSTEALRFEAHVFSNDWDLAQVLPTQAAGEDPIPIRLFTTRGDERTVNDVLREFGVGPDKLAELKALAGDPSDGYKPFPGEAPGKPGIGDKGAADILKSFGSAHSALAAALSNLDAAFAQKGLPKRIPALLRRGGEEALRRGLQLATLRGDVPVPTDFEVGDWEEAEATLLERKLEQERVASTRSLEAVLVESQAVVEDRLGPKPSEVIGGPPREEIRQFDRGVEVPAERPREIVRCLDRGEECARYDVPERPLVERTAERIAERVSSVPEEVLPPIDRLREVVERASAEHEALPPGERLAAERTGDEILAALEPHDRTVILTGEEFLAIAPLPALHSAGMLAIPDDFQALNALLFALQRGEIRLVSCGLFIGHVTEKAAVALDVIAGVAKGINDGREIDPGLESFAEFMKGLARATAMVSYGNRLVRAM